MYFNEFSRHESKDISYTFRREYLEESRKDLIKEYNDTLDKIVNHISFILIHKKLVNEVKKNEIFYRVEQETIPFEVIDLYKSMFDFKQDEYGDFYSLYSDICASKQTGLVIKSFVKDYLLCVLDLSEDEIEEYIEIYDENIIYEYEMYGEYEESDDTYESNKKTEKHNELKEKLAKHRQIKEKIKNIRTDITDDEFIQLLFLDDKLRKCVFSFLKEKNVQCYYFNPESDPNLFVIKLYI